MKRSTTPTTNTCEPLEIAVLYIAQHQQVQLLPKEVHALRTDATSLSPVVSVLAFRSLSEIPIVRCVAHLNLLYMTPIINNTNTVIIAIVIIRFVAILYSRDIRRQPRNHILVKNITPIHRKTSEQKQQLSSSTKITENKKKSNSPPRHPPQSLHTPIHIALTLQQILMRVFNHIPLLM